MTSATPQGTEITILVAGDISALFSSLGTTFLRAAA